ncbi:MAG TPA: aminotransferase class I/II-fold pyridoxal phosphate-dependent enzyme [Xanthomonadales bacterium]|nr:aminotransferase class I/II-fold pyridoxal phosphate-dependent enzyme [Xanthomonadales bacterium]
MTHRCMPGARRLSEVRYEIRGDLAHRAREIEARGEQIVRLNIGNPGIFGFTAPAHVREAVERNVVRSEAYCQEQGIAPAREAIAAQQAQRGAFGAAPDHVFVGNGVSELIDLSLRALLDEGDEVLLPAPDYPLWTASVLLNGGTPVPYECAPENGFVPDPDAVEAAITPRTKALVVINPNNPTGAVYPREVLARLADIARRHRLVLMSDEIYDGITYDDAEFVPIAPLAGDALCLSFGGLSKLHRACGYRIGWMSLSGDWKHAQAYLHGLVLLASMRLCSNVPGQWAIPAALSGPETMSALTNPGGRLHESRRAVVEACARSEFLSLVAPRGALYAFPGVDRGLVPGFDDEAFALRLLETEHVLLVAGSSFNVPYRNHFRVTLLPEAPVMRDVFARIERALAREAERAAPVVRVA